MAAIFYVHMTMHSIVFSIDKFVLICSLANKHTSTLKKDASGQRPKFNTIQSNIVEALPGSLFGLMNTALGVFGLVLTSRFIVILMKEM